MHGIHSLRAGINHGSAHCVLTRVDLRSLSLVQLISLVLDLVAHDIVFFDY